MRSTWGEGSARAVSSLSRVSGVRRSWLTAARRVVRCSMWRWMRARMAKKAPAAWRTSRAPWGLKWGVSIPRPKASAAAASRSMARTWLRMNPTATAVSSRVAPASHSRKVKPRVEKARSRGASTRSTPPGSATRMST